MSEEPVDLVLNEHRILCVHGDVHDPYWGKMGAEEMQSLQYGEYDFVFSGHTHVPHLHYAFDKKSGRRTAFVNPGSVGQPRNCNPRAQYAMVDLETSMVCFENIPYDVATEQSLFTNELHPYYRERLEKGI